MPAAPNLKKVLTDQIVKQVNEQTPAAAAAVATAVVTLATKADLSRIADTTPDGRLRRKIDKTIQSAERTRDDALDDNDQPRADTARRWIKTAKALRNKLDLPVTTSKIKHRRQIRDALAALHAQMGLDPTTDDRADDTTDDTADDATPAAGAAQVPDHTDHQATHHTTQK